MPTDKPRVNVTLSVEDFELLSRLAKQQKRSRSDMLRDLFQTIRPVLERVAVVTEAALRAQSTARQGLIDSAEKAEAELLPMVQQALGQFDLFVADVQQQAAAADERAGGAPAAPRPAPEPPASNTGVRSAPSAPRKPAKPPRRVVSKNPGRGVRGRKRR
jgi:hypothetical protein